MCSDARLRQTQCTFRLFSIDATCCKWKMFYKDHVSCWSCWPTLLADISTDTWFHTLAEHWLKLGGYMTDILAESRLRVCRYVNRCVSVKCRLSSGGDINRSLTNTPSTFNEYSVDIPY